MDNPTAKELLAAYRPHGADAQDPFFAEALAQSRRDPELAAWLEREQAMDLLLAESLAAIPVPQAGKQLLAKTLGLSVPRRRIPWSRAVLGMAALLAIGLAAWHHLAPPPFPPRAGEFRLASLASSIQSLAYTGESLEANRAWLASRNAPVPKRLPENLTLATAQGCRTYGNERDGMVSVICLTLEGERVHVFTFDAKAARHLNLPDGEWVHEDGWHFLAWSEKGKRVALATRGQPFPFALPTA